MQRAGWHLAQRLHEPVTVILVVAGAQSTDEAREVLLAACAAARFRHSTGYRGYIDSGSGAVGIVEPNARQWP